MSTVTVEQGKIRVGDERLALISGEIHYWRLDPANWRLVLQRARELDLNIVASYVCWDYHELQPGRYDFHGESDPRRDLVGFLELASAEDFWIILRPGPYIYSEWHNHGVPDYAARLHRLDPAFQAAARPYMEAVVEAVRPHLATRGGRIICWQADNEIDPWPHWYTQQLGLGSEPGPFQAFLRQQYRSIDALNEAWGASYIDFEEPHATRLMTPDQPDLMRRYMDFVNFRHWYVNQVASWASDAYRALGVDVPIILNTYSGVETQRWADMEETADIVGPDIYPSNEFAHRANEHRNFLDAVRYTRTYSRLPYIAEFEVGIWDDWLEDVQPLSPNHYRLMCLSALLAGVVGWNWYMLVNRDNWYMSPINEWGRTRPHLYETFRQIVGVYRELDPAGLTRLTNTALTYDPVHRSTTRPGQELLQAFYDAAIDYDFYDPERGRCRQPLLFYAGAHWASAAAQDNLRRYVEEGGHLVCLGNFPRYDARFRPHNALEVPLPGGIVNNAPARRPLALSAGDFEATVNSSWFYNYDRVPGTPITAQEQASTGLTAQELALQNDLQTGNTYTVGFTRSLGQGRLTVLGLEPSPLLLSALHRYAAVPIPVRATTPGVTAGLYRRGDTFYVIVVNNGHEAKTATLLLDEAVVPDTPYDVQALVHGEQEPAHRLLARSQGRRVLNVALPRKDGTVLRLEVT